MPMNGLYRLAAISAILVGVFLILGGYGHIVGVLPRISAAESVAEQLRLWSPGLILGLAGAFSIALSRMLWGGRRLAVDAALGISALALSYLVYLLHRGVPEHPVGLFTGIVACQGVLLLALRAGLVWPVPGPDGELAEPFPRDRSGESAARRVAGQ